MDITKLLTTDNCLSLIYSKTRETNTRFVLPTIFNIVLGLDSARIKRESGTPVFFVSLVDYGIVMHKIMLLLKKAKTSIKENQLRFSTSPLELSSDSNVDKFINHAKEMNFSNGLILLNTLNSAHKVNGRSTSSTQIVKSLPKIKRNLLLIQKELSCAISMVLTTEKINQELLDLIDVAIEVSSTGHQITKGDKTPTKIFQIA